MAFDVCHEQIVRALENAGWAVAPKQFKLYADDREIFVDIRASREVNGSREHMILVEVKCFPDRDSTTQELYIAIGQYIVYRAVLAELNISTPLYLAVPEDAYKAIFDPTALRAVKDSQIKMVIVNLDTEAILNG